MKTRRSASGSVCEQYDMMEMELLIADVPRPPVSWSAKNSLERTTKAAANRKYLLESQIVEKGGERESYNTNGFRLDR